MNQLRCRRCESSQGFRSSIKRRSFFLPGSKPQYAPDIPFKMQNILIDVEVDPLTKWVSGFTTQRVRTVSPLQKKISLDQIALTIEGAWIDGQKVPFEVEGHKVHLILDSVFPNGPQVDHEFEYKVQFKKNNPKRGLYFTGPDPFYPQKRHQVWSQGQDEDNRFWFPTYDYPNQKATSEIIAKVPKGFTAVSNGALISQKTLGEHAVFHYRLGTPHVTYLISLVVAEFSAWEDKGPRGLPVQYFVEPGREADGKRAFSHTPQMIQAFENKIGVEYPYEKYSQVAVQDFIFGGMENTSATTQTDRTLHDERAHPDFSSDPLVAHELAHQWFGDLLTCRDWSHGWLNEGFATFMERVWVECDQTSEGGPDNAKYYQYNDLKEYLEEDSSAYRRPIVCHQYQEPIDLFDRHLYQKGGLVLNLLRAQLGEQQFWKAIHVYVQTFKGKSVETVDLIRVIKDVTGRNMREFFDHWVFGAGHPDFEVQYQLLTDRNDQKIVELVIEQKQTQGKEVLQEGDIKTHLFKLDVRVDFVVEGSDSKQVTETKQIRIGEVRDRILIPVSGKPLMIRFDPDSTIPKTLKFTRPKEMLLYQLQHDSDCMGRIDAAKALSKDYDLSSVQALEKALLTDTFWGVQAEVAQVLGKMHLDAAEAALLKALSCVPHSRARAAIVKALSEFRSDQVAEALKKHAQNDPSYLVEAAAIQAMVKVVLPRSRTHTSEKVGEVERFLLKNLEKNSYLDIVRSATIKAMAHLPGLERGEHREALRWIADWTHRGKSTDCRVAGVQALGGLLPWCVPSVRVQILDVFQDLLEEDTFRVRMALVGVLAQSHLPDAIALLSRIRDVELDGRVKRDCQVAIADLSEVTHFGGATESVSSLKSEFDKMKDEFQKVKTELENIKAQVKG